LKGYAGKLLYRVWVYQRYVHGTLLGGIVVALLILVPVHAAAAVLLAPTVLSSPGGGPGLGFVASATELLLVFITVFMVASYAGDLSGGGGQLFLSQPLSRAGYAAAWLVATVATPCLVYALSLALPLLIIDPRLLSALGLWNLMRAVLEVAEWGAFLFLLATVSRSRALVVILGLFAELLLPWILLLPMALFAVVPGTPPYSVRVFATVYVVLYPSKYSFFSQGGAVLVGPGAAAAEASTLMAAYAVAALLYAKERMEVV